MDLFLVRHGESDIPPDTFQNDFPLSELGLRQAGAMAERFRDIRIDHLMTTPYLRTSQTAEAVAKVAGMTAIEEPGLGSFRAGGFHDVPVSKAREAYPEWFEKAYPLQTYELAGGESAAAFFERVTEAFIEKVWDRFSETRDLNVVVVCHEETINALLHHFLGIEFTGFQTFKLDHTSITRLNSRMKRPRITAINDIAHLVMAGIPVGASGTGRAAG
ncbi:MAG: histidine phosphatase family protein [Dehalococcoidia bacterium]|nr:MAG: histidine phosphatase family protein [Dehalococcoidia bacterium]